MIRLGTHAMALVFLTAAGTAQALNYDETVNGELSDDRLNPTGLTFATGTNTLSMSTQSGDRDYFTFTVPSGWNLSSIFHQTYESTDFRGFIGFQSGITLTEPPTGTNAINLLGYTLFGVDTVGTEIIDDLAASGSEIPAATGFVAPLPAGDYTFWMQQTGGLSTYSFNFTITPVPEPEQWALMLAGGLFLAARMRKMRFS
jgi:hypothetical protein